MSFRKTYFHRISTVFLLLYLSTALFFALSCPADELRVYYISVGQGDAQYIELPNGENVLIDGGPSSTDSTSNPLIFFLERKGVSKINHVILSHAHLDHYNGLSPVFDRYLVEKYYDSFITGSSTAETFRNKAKNRSQETVNTLSLPNGATFYWCTTSTPPVTAILLHRGDAFGATPSQNDASLVFKVAFGSSTFIFGGDAGAGGSYKPLESWLANVNNHGAVLQSDCYKVHHHGSSSSSSDVFLNALKPKYAFIGTNGMSHGHPTTAAMDRIDVWTGAAAVDNSFSQEIKGKFYHD